MPPEENDDAPDEVSLPTARTRAIKQTQQESAASKAAVTKRKSQAREKEAWFREQKVGKVGKKTSEDRLIKKGADGAGSPVATAVGIPENNSGDEGDFGSDISELTHKPLASSALEMNEMADLESSSFRKGSKRNRTKSQTNVEFPEFIPLERSSRNLEFVPVSSLKKKAPARESALDHLRNRYKPSVFQKRIPAAKLQSVLAKQRARNVAK